MRCTVSAVAVAEADSKNSLRFMTTSFLAAGNTPEASSSTPSAGESAAQHDVAANPAGSEPQPLPLNIGIVTVASRPLAMAARLGIAPFSELDSQRSLNIRVGRVPAGKAVSGKRSEPAEGLRASDINHCVRCGESVCF